MERNVIANMTKLTSLFQGPAKIIDKRRDKLLDFDSCQIRVERIKEPERLKLVINLAFFTFMSVCLCLCYPTFGPLLAQPRNNTGTPT